MISRFREESMPVIKIQHESKALGLLKGKEGFDVVRSIKFADGDTSIVKTRANSFINTELGSILKQNRIDNLVICGFAAEACVFQTYRGSKKQHYGAVVLKGGIASGTKLLLRIIENITKAKTNEEIEI